MGIPLRKVLADSHVASVAIAVLLFWSLDSAFWALRSPLFRGFDFIITALAIRDIPYFSWTSTTADELTTFIPLAFLFESLACFAAAALLSRWVYGVGPFRSLREYRQRLARRINAQSS